MKYLVTISTFLVVM